MWRPPSSSIPSAQTFASAPPVSIVLDQLFLTLTIVYYVYFNLLLHLIICHTEQTPAEFRHS